MERPFGIQTNFKTKIQKKLFWSWCPWWNPAQQGKLLIMQAVILIKLSRHHSKASLPTNSAQI